MLLGLLLRWHRGRPILAPAEGQARARRQGAVLEAPELRPARLRRARGPGHPRARLLRLALPLQGRDGVLRALHREELCCAHRVHRAFPRSRRRAAAPEQAPDSVRHPLPLRSPVLSPRPDLALPRLHRPLRLHLLRKVRSLLPDARPRPGSCARRRAGLLLREVRPLFRGLSEAGDRLFLPRHLVPSPSLWRFPRGASLASPPSALYGHELRHDHLDGLLRRDHDPPSSTWRRPAASSSAAGP